jgi:hypothetical protein
LALICAGNTQVLSSNATFEWNDLALFLRDTNWPLQEITAFGLSLRGPLTPLGAFFPDLYKLDLSNNKLTGAIPGNLLTNMNSMSHLNLSGNLLNGMS